MKIEEEVGKARDMFRAKRVYGAPIERNGVTMLPAAEIFGAGGGGGGESSEGETGGGSGFGIHARPVGAWVVSDDRAEWKPSVDVNRAILGIQLLALLALFVWLRRHDQQHG